MPADSNPANMADWHLTKQLEEHARTDHIVQFFKFGHLPPTLANISRPFAWMAVAIMTLPRNPERTVALRKLLESKDAAVRAGLEMLRG